MRMDLSACPFIEEAFVVVVVVNVSCSERYLPNRPRKSSFAPSVWYPCSILERFSCSCLIVVRIAVLASLFVIVGNARTSEEALSTRIAACVFVLIFSFGYKSGHFSYNFVEQFNIWRP